MQFQQIPVRKYSKINSIMYLSKDISFRRKCTWVHFDSEVSPSHAIFKSSLCLVINLRFITSIWLPQQLAEGVLGTKHITKVSWALGYKLYEICLKCTFLQMAGAAFVQSCILEKSFHIQNIKKIRHNFQKHINYSKRAVQQENTTYAFSIRLWSCPILCAPPIVVSHGQNKYKRDGLVI